MPTVDRQFPPGWNDDRVKRLFAHNDAMTEEEQVAEDEAAVIDRASQTVIAVPDALLAAIRQLLAGAENSRTLRQSLSGCLAFRSLQLYCGRSLARLMLA